MYKIYYSKKVFALIKDHPVNYIAVFLKNLDDLG